MPIDHRVSVTGHAFRRWRTSLNAFGIPRTTGKRNAVYVGSAIFLEGTNIWRLQLHNMCGSPTMIQSHIVVINPAFEFRCAYKSRLLGVSGKADIDQSSGKPVRSSMMFSAFCIASEVVCIASEVVNEPSHCNLPTQFRIGMQRNCIIIWFVLLLYTQLACQGSGVFPRAEFENNIIF